MTTHDAIKHIKEKIESAKYTDNSYIDCVNVEALETVLDLCKNLDINLSTFGTESKVGKKYMIEIAQEYVQDYPTHLYKDSLLTAPKKLYRVAGFNSLVFDEAGLTKLTPLDIALEKSFDDGYNKAIQEERASMKTIDE